MNFETLESRTLLASTISGFVFNDANANGVRDAGERGLNGVKVYLDLNHDGSRQSNEPMTKSKKKGAYSFDNLSAGTFELRIVQPKKQRLTAPQTGSFTVIADGNDIHAALDFGLTRTAKVSGKVFNDLDGNGVQNGGEQGIPGVIVFLDKNRNGVWDSSKELALETDDDGLYSFESVPAKKYILRVAFPDGATATTPLDGLYKLKIKAGQVVNGRDFGLQ